MCLARSPVLWCCGVVTAPPRVQVTTSDYADDEIEPNIAHNFALNQLKVANSGVGAGVWCRVTRSPPLVLRAETVGATTSGSHLGPKHACTARSHEAVRISSFFACEE